jgi:uncharacterized protein YdeI (YjbR/CyaY-like superfamily)
MNPKVDTYLIDGCGRCSNYQTPQCKVHTWSDELKLLRRIVLDCGLREELKWSQPCYTFRGNNILIVTAFKEYTSLTFFKGALLKDPNHILTSPGKNSQSIRQVRFTNVQEIVDMETVLKAYLFEAVEVEKAGLKVNFIKTPEPIPEELQQKLNENIVFRKAFEALTPGRQRGYTLYFSQPRQSRTRTARIEKCVQIILKGEGLNDNYRSKRK